MADIVLRATVDRTQLRRALKQAEGDVRQFGRRGAQQLTPLERSFSGLGRTFARFLGPAALAVSARQFVRMADSASLLRSQIRLVSQDSADLARNQAAIFMLAQETRSEYAATVTLYTRIARATEELNVAQSDVLTATRAINQAFVIGGATQQEATAATIQLGQALASGQLRGEELRSVMEQAPRLARALAEELGVSLGELREMGFAGRLLSEDVFRAIVNRAGELNEEFGEVERTFGQTATQLGTSFLGLADAINRATGATGFFQQILDRIRTDVDNLRTTIDPSTRTPEQVATRREELAADLLRLRRQIREAQELGNDALVANLQNALNHGIRAFRQLATEAAPSLDEASAIGRQEQRNRRQREADSFAFAGLTGDAAREEIARRVELSQVLAKALVLQQQANRAAEEDAALRRRSRILAGDRTSGFDAAALGATLQPLSGSTGRGVNLFEQIETQEAEVSLGMRVNSFLENAINRVNYDDPARSLATAIATQLITNAITQIGSLVSGGGFSLGGLLSFHEGGIVPGSQGQERLAVLEAGEGVFTQEQLRAGVGAPNVTIPLTVNGDLNEQSRKAILDFMPEISQQVQQDWTTRGVF